MPKRNLLSGPLRPTRSWKRSSAYVKELLGQDTRSYFLLDSSALVSESVCRGGPNSFAIWVISCNIHLFIKAPEILYTDYSSLNLICAKLCIFDY